MKEHAVEEARGGTATTTCFSRENGGCGNDHPMHPTDNPNQLRIQDIASFSSTGVGGNHFYVVSTWNGSSVRTSPVVAVHVQCKLLGATGVVGCRNEKH